jgi:flagellar biosynthesis/type III secretory pathway protein FliH
MRQAASQGYEQGKAQAIAEWNSQLKAQVEQLAASCSALLNPLAEQQQRLTGEMLNLSVMLAEQLINQELSQNPDVYWSWVQEAITHMPSARKDATLYLPESAVDLVAEHKPGKLQNVSLVADASLALGAYRIESGPSELVFDAGARLRQWRKQVQPKAELSPALKNYQPLDPIPATPAATEILAEELNNEEWVNLEANAEPDDNRAEAEA